MKEYNIQRGMKSKMQVYLEDEMKFFESHADILDDVYKVMEACLKEEHVPYEVEVSLTVVNMHEIQEINKEYRLIDKPTDVLSFPQIEPETNGQIKWEDEEAEEVMLGDIVLCYEKALEQAKEYEHSLKREVCFLIAHSMFHLLGYDHMNEEDEKLMFGKQEHILNLLNILR